MQEKPQKITEAEFNERFLTSIDEALSTIGESAKNAVYLHLEKKFRLTKREIPQQICAFTEAIEALFGAGSKPLELMFMEKLHAKVKGNCESVKPVTFNFVTYVNAIKKSAVSVETNDGKTNQIDVATQKRSESEDGKNFLTLINSLADPVAVVGAKGRFLCLNAAFDKVIGSKPGEWVGKSFMESPNLPNASKMRLAENLQRRSTGLHVEPYEVDIVDNNGELLQYEINAKKIDYLGQAAVLVMCRDVTQRKRDERQLKSYTERLELLVDEKTSAIKESEKKIRGLFDSSPEGIVLAKPGGMVSECNQAFLNLLRYSSKNEVLGKDAFSLIRSRDRKRIAAIITKALQQGETTIRNVEGFFVTQNGIEVAVEFSVSVIKDSSENVICYVGTTKDITKRLEAEEKLLASEKKYRRLSEQLEAAQAHLLEERDRAQNYLEVAGVMLLALDTKGNIILLNRKGCSIIGCETKDVFGKNWFEMFVPKDVRAERKRLHNLRISGTLPSPNLEEAIIQCMNGAKRTIAWRHTLLKDHDGRVIGTLSSGEDVTEQKQMQQALMESEEKFRSIVENSNDVIFLTHADGSFSYVSPSVTKLLGYTPEEVKAGIHVVHSDDKAKAQTVKAQGIMGKSGFDAEFRLLTKQGEIKWISTSWTPIFEDGRVRLVSSVIRDITERKRLEDDLRASEERFRAISTSARDAILLVDETGTVVYWNPAAVRIFGYAAEEATGKKFANLIVPECDHDHYKFLLQKLANDSLTEEHFEVKSLRKSGESFPVELSATSLKLKDKNCMLAVIRDISERKKMETALKQERDMLEDMAANIDAGLAIISRDYRILWANRLLKQISGGDLENKPCYSVFDKSGKVCADCGVKKVFENGVTTDRHDYLHKGDKGNDEWVELIVTPIKDKDGNIVAALELAVNVNERKQMQKKLADYSEKLEELVAERSQQLAETQAKLVKSERLAAIGELAGMVGHDLRNPLTSIKGAAYFLKGKYSPILDDLGKEMLVTIDKSVEYSNKIINDLLDYSREIKLDLSETTPAFLLKNALAMIETSEKIKIADCTTDVPNIRADTAKMSRVFMNLVRNAFDAMPQGGTLTITSKEEKDNWVIAFADTGVGMSPETMSCLWTPLFTTKAKGMGFGLSICKRIVEAHGGRIAVDSAANRGTVFTLILPKSPKVPTEKEDLWVFPNFEIGATVKGGSGNVKRRSAH